MVARLSRALETVCDGLPHTVTAAITRHPGPESEEQTSACGVRHVREKQKREGP